MYFDRRNMLSAAAGSAAVAILPRVAFARTAPPDTFRELQALYAEAAKAGLDRPRSAGVASPLDLADLVNDALSAPQNDDVSAVANRAGLLLSELTRQEHDGIAVEEPAPATPRALTSTMADDYRRLFSSAQVHDSHKSVLRRVAKFITSHSAKARYKEVEADTRVPWFVVGALHYREANLNFLGHLHNGDPLMLRTVHVPTNRPPTPWPTPGLTPLELWRTSAEDALRRFPTSAAWTLPSICFFMESYNGFGCRDAGINSPYLWNFTQHYTRGGFPRDHFYSPDYVSKQAGLMAVLVAIKTVAPDDVTFPM